jgi:hypothetical protein
MDKNLESEVKTVKPKTRANRARRRDPTLTGGERAETPQEKQERERRAREPKEAPIIQKDVT